MPIRLTLRYRIISLVGLFAVLLIAAFTAVLIQQQLKIINENNLYRARVGSYSAKGAFERTLLLSARTGKTAESFRELIPLLQEGQLVEAVTVADLKNKIVAGSRPDMLGTELPEARAEKATYARKNYSPKSWFYPEVFRDEIYFYAPVTLDDVPQYVAIFRYSLGNMRDAMRQAFQLCIFVNLIVLLALVPLCLLLIKSILGPITELNDATQDITSGNLNRRVEIVTEDELGELAETFNQMTSALVTMKSRAENANPLTKLPGNNMIHEEIEKRIKGKKKFVAVYSDLDNFKAFNDKYGIGAGDQAIKLTAQIMKESIKKGAAGDFLGHEGGDDFIILSTPEKTADVTNHICTEFDKRVRELFSEEDRNQGYIISKDREGNVKQFPLMTISLAGVGNMIRELTSYAEVTNICAEVKKKAKMMSKETGKSSFYLDKRTGNERTDGHADPAHPAEPPATPPPAAH